MKLALTVPTPEVTISPPLALLAGGFRERLEKASRMSFDGIELLVVDPARLEVQEIRCQLDALNLKAAAISSGAILAQTGLSLLACSGEIVHQAAERLHALIDLAAALDAPTVTIGSFRGRPEPETLLFAREQLHKLLMRAAEHAQRAGVSLALEPLNRYETDLIHSAWQGLEFLAGTGDSSLGLLLDCFHMNIEEADIREAIQQTMGANRLFHIHLADSNRLSPGQGHFDFPGLINALSSTGYSGWLSAEHLPIPDPDRAAQLTIEYMHRLLSISPEHPPL